MRWIKFVAVFALVALVLNIGSGVARADGPSGGSDAGVVLMGNGPDPNYVPTAQELKALTAKDVQAKQHLQQRRGTNSIVPLSIGRKTLSVYPYTEPPGKDYVNYCGPGATQVILSARLPTNQIPNIYNIGADESQYSWGNKTDIKTKGVLNTAVRTELNNLLSTSFYVYAVASGRPQLETWVVSDIDANYALDSSLMTGGMPGWGTLNVKHIVAIYGYNEPDLSHTYFYYTETASKDAGFNGTYWNYVISTTFWNYVVNNNSQVW
jgi:hypothetical protein